MTFVLDAVCEKLILKTEAKVFLRFEGRLYHFCSERCCERFENDPWKYLTEEKPPGPAP